MHADGLVDGVRFKFKGQTKLEKCSLSTDNEGIIELTTLQATHVEGWELMNGGKCLASIKEIIVAANNDEENNENSQADVSASTENVSSGTEKNGCFTVLSAADFKTWWNDNYEDATEKVGRDPSEAGFITKLEQWAMKGSDKQETLVFLASMRHQNPANFMSYKLKFWVEKTTELLKKDCTSWLPLLKTDQVIDEEYLKSSEGTEKSMKVREWWTAHESTHAIVNGGANPLKSSKKELVQWAKEPKHAALRSDLVRIVACTRDKILEQSWPEGHWLVNLKKRQRRLGTFDEVWHDLESNKKSKTDPPVSTSASSSLSMKVCEKHVQGTTSSGNSQTKKGSEAENEIGEDFFAK